MSQNPNKSDLIQASDLCETPEGGGDTFDIRRERLTLFHSSDWLLLVVIPQKSPNCLYLSIKKKKKGDNCCSTADTVRLILFWHCVVVCYGWCLPVQRHFSVFCGRLCTWHFHDSCLVWWLAWRLTEPLLRQNQAAFVCMAREHYQTTVFCVCARMTVPVVKIQTFDAYQCLKPNSAWSVLIGWTTLLSLICSFILACSLLEFRMHSS